MCWQCSDMQGMHSYEPMTLTLTMCKPHSEHVHNMASHGAAALCWYQMSC